MTMKKRNWIVLALVVLLVLSLAARAVPFDASSVLFTVSLNKNDITRRALSISSPSGGEFTVATPVSGVTIDPPQFSLEAGTATVDVVFDSSGVDPSVYVGDLTIISDSDTLDIPLIFEVESQDVFFDGTVTLPSGDVPIGGKLLAQVKIFDLISAGEEDLGPSIVDTDYFVYTSDGTVIHTESERLSVERQTQISKAVVFPDHVKEGTYVFAAVIRYKSSIAAASAPFRISASSDAASVASSNARFDRQFFLVLGAVLIFFVILIGLFVYLIHDRDKFIIDLRQFHSSEMEQHHHFLTAQAEVIHHRTRAHRTELARQVRHKIQLLKKKHKKQVEEMERLRRAGEIKKMQQKLAEWKKAGFNTLGLEYRLKGMTTKDITGIMEKLKKSYRVEGYKKSK
jgi:hypothetical protein